MQNLQIVDDDQGDDDIDLIRLMITMMVMLDVLQMMMMKAPQMEARGAVAEAEDLRGRGRRPS